MKMFRVREAVVRYKTTSAAVDKIEKPEDVYAFSERMLKGETRECLYCLYLDINGRIVCFEKVSIGKSDCAFADLKEIIRKGLLVGAEALILVHNHTSGDSTPSPEDKSFSVKLREVSRMFDMELLDHVVIGDGEYTSLKEIGIL